MRGTSDPAGSWRTYGISILSKTTSRPSSGTGDTGSKRVLCNWSSGTHQRPWLLRRISSAGYIGVPKWTSPRRNRRTSPISWLSTHKRMCPSSRHGCTGCRAEYYKTYPQWDRSAASHKVWPSCCSSEIKPTRFGGTPEKQSYTGGGWFLG